MTTNSDVATVEKSAESDSDSTEQGEEVYQVEKILSKRLKSGKLEYYIKWKGYDDPKDNTWEPEENCQCPDLIREFKQRCKSKTIIPNDESRKRKSSSISIDSKGEIKKKYDNIKTDGNINKEKVGNKKTAISKEMIMTSDSSSEDDESKENKASSFFPPLLADPFLPEPSDDKQYDIQAGKKLSTVLGVKKNEKFGMVALVRYEDGKYELVPSSLLVEHSPKDIVSFYESRLRFF